MYGILSNEKEGTVTNYLKNVCGVKNEGFIKRCLSSDFAEELYKYAISNKKMDETSIWFAMIHYDD